MPPTSSVSVREYLGTSIGKRNGVFAIGILVLGFAIFSARGFGSDLLLFIFIALCATAAFFNLWREATICFVVGFVFWHFIVLPLWIAAINVLTFVPALGGVLLDAFAFGFLFADVFSPAQTRLPGDSPSLYERIISPGRKARQLLSSVLPLTDLRNVPRFSANQAAQGAGKSVFDVSTDKGTEPYLEAETVQENRSSALSAPIAGSGLYIYTFILEFVSAIARSVVIAIATTILLFPVYLILFAATTTSYSDPGEWLVTNTIISAATSLIIGVCLGFWPLLASLFHVLLPISRSGGGPTERDTLGAREPTREEMETIIDTVQRIQAASGKVIKKGAPSEWLVLDEPFPDAYTIGSTVYLTRAAIENDNLAGIMAHEMGHIAHKDGDLLLSLRRFIVPLAYWVGIDRQATAGGAVLGTGSTARLGSTQTEDEKIFFRFQSLKIKLWLAFWFGGLGLLILGRTWAAFWRQRDFMADEYAVKLGQADSLMGILEIYRHIDVAQPYLLTNRPYTAERLDRLKG